MAGVDTPQNKTMDISTLKAVLDSEKMAAMAAFRAGKLSVERQRALNYYMGDISADMPNQDGRSQAVSTDVSDTIDGLMPALMDIFFGGDEIVRFDPTGPNDVEAAAQETDYINDVFMKQNPGFQIGYTFMKDALLSKTGVVKVYWEEREETEEETYENLDDQQFALFAADPNVKIIEHTTKDQPDDYSPDNDPSTNPSYS